MKILVIGAAGKTGAEVVRQAIAQDHEVTVLVHTTKGYEDPGVTLVLEGDATDPAIVDRAVAGQQAVLDAVGGKTPFLDTTLERTVAATVVQAMQRHGVRRLVVVSMLGEGDSKADAPWLYEHILLPIYLRGADKDKAAMEATVQASDLDWVILRPAVLSDDPATGEVKVFSRSADGSTSDGTAATITRGDLAAVMLAQLSGDENLHQAVTVANP